jgi:hypothetical protein
VLEQSKLLDSIGTAQMEKELQTTVLTIAKKTSHQMKENSGIEASLNEDDLRDYMSVVMNELNQNWWEMTNIFRIELVLFAYIILSKVKVY